MRINSQDEVNSVSEICPRKNYIRDSSLFTTALSTPSYKYSRNYFYNRCATGSLPSSPETMSFSSPDPQLSSDDEDIGEDNLLLMPMDNTIKKTCVFDEHYQKRKAAIVDTRWTPIYRDFATDTIDHGYHSMEPLIGVNDSSKLNVNVKESYQCLVDSNNGMEKRLLTASLNNNHRRFSDSMWHSSPWSAPQKSHNFRINSFGEYFGASFQDTRECKSAAPDFNIKAYDCHSWQTDESVNHLYINERAEIDSDYSDPFEQDYSWSCAKEPERSYSFKTIEESHVISKQKQQYDNGKWQKSRKEYSIKEIPYSKSAKFSEFSRTDEHCLAAAAERCSTGRGNAIQDRRETQKSLKSSPKSPKLSEDNQQAGSFNKIPEDLSVRLSVPPSQKFSNAKVSVDGDVNLVSRSFNNFSITSNKQNEILRLLQEKKRIVEANICEIQPRCETKILNTGKNLFRTSAVMRPRRIGRKHFSSLAGSGYPEIADGLVLEKVRYNPNWRRQNSVLCSTEDPVKQFCTDLKVHNPLSVPSDTPKTFDDHTVTMTEEQKSPEPKPPANSNNPSPAAYSVESPTENVTPSMRVEAPPLIRMSTSGSNMTLSIEKAPPTREMSTCGSNGTPSMKETPPPGEVSTSGLSNVDSDRKPKTVSKQMSDLLGDFDVYDIASTMPTIDWAAMEAHLTRAAEEDHWSARQRNEREEIRRRLALGPDADEYYFCNGSVKKPSLTTRLQNGMNLQICFMNETASDSDCNDSDTESNSNAESSETKSLLQKPASPNNNSVRTLLSTSDSDQISQESLTDSSQDSISSTKRQRPSFFFAKQRSWRLRPRHKHEDPVVDNKEQNAAKEVEDFYTRQAKLQAEARLALSQAKEMARMQMEIERQNCKQSPISDIVKLSLSESKQFPINRQTLSGMNIAQLQVIVNDLHTQIETLNEDLVRLLLSRDDLHMEQDSMLVDIEDLTRYLGAKETGDIPLQVKDLSLK